MAQNTEKEPSFQITVKDFLCSHLGASFNDRGDLVPGEHVKSSLQIPFNVAASIFEVCQNKYLAYIQWPEENSQIKFPVLWDVRDWNLSFERERLRQERAHADRIKYFIMEENIKIIATHIFKEFGVAFDIGVLIAARVIRKKPAFIRGYCKLCNIKHLIEKEEEL